MTPAEERAAWERHNLDQLRQWRDLTFRQKLQSLENMDEFARHVEAMRLQQNGAARRQEQYKPESPAKLARVDPPKLRH